MLGRSFLILSFLTLASCKDPVPVTTLDIPDFKLNFTERYKVIDQANLNVQSDQELPLSAVDGEVCLQAKEYLEFKKWSIRMQQQNASCNQSASKAPDVR